MTTSLFIPDVCQTAIVDDVGRYKVTSVRFRSLRSFIQG